MFQLGLDPTGRGPRSDARRLRDQMERLFRATISFDRTVTEEGRAGDIWLNMEITSGGEMWWSPRDPSQTALWGSWIELGEKFFRAIIAHPVPLDMRALKALKRSPLALDLYSWLTYEAYRTHKSGKGGFVAWGLLAEQMGTDYADTHNFQKKAVATLRKIQALYPTLKLGPLRGGIRIEPESLPAITPQPVEDTADERREIRRLMATVTRDAWERTFDGIHTALEREAERDGSLRQIDITFRSGAVISLTPDPICRGADLKAALEQIHEELRKLLDA